MSHLSQEEIQKLWNDQEELLSKILDVGMEKYVEGLDDLGKAFLLDDKNLRCIDEGTPGGLHCAGSGILMDENTAIEEFKKAGVSGIYSHEECGAAGLYAKQKGLPVDDADKYGIKWAKRLAGLLGIPYKGHIGIKNMARPSGFHIARVSYYDGTGKFDPSKCKKLPNGFVIDRKNHSAEYSLREMEVSIGIALFGHGFGEKFTKETPFILIAVGDLSDPNFSAESLQKELGAIANKYDGRVKVDGFNA